MPNGPGRVTPDLLFRGDFDGEKVGPYVSQFFLSPTTLAAQPIDQKYITYKARIDYMTCLSEWEQVQSGMSTGKSNEIDPSRRYLRDGRSLAAYTHVDELFQAYFTAYLVLRSMNAPINPGNPYLFSRTQNGFGTFGPPDFASVLDGIVGSALTRAAEVLRVGDVFQPHHVYTVFIRVLDGKVNHGVIGSGTVPVAFTWLNPYRVPRPDHLRELSLALYTAYARHHVQRLTQWMGVPGCTRTRCKRDAGRF